MTRRASALRVFRFELAGLGADTGWLVLFDRRGGQPPIEAHTSATAVVSPGGRTVQVIRG